MTGAYALLRRQAGTYYLAAIAAAAVAAAAVGSFHPVSPVEWVISGAAFLLVLTFEAAALWKGLAQNTSPAGELRDDLGAANRITLFRGWLTALTAGVLTLQATGGLPVRGDAVAWMPALLYTVSLILDAVDGAVARKTASVTPLGRLLENEYDSLGVLVLAVFLAVTGRAYPFILLAGVARYLFVFGMWARRRLGMKTHPLSHSKSGKVIAGLMMGYLSAGLWPVFSTRYVSIAGIVFFIPFAAGFLRDWLAVCGRIDLDSPRYRRLTERLTAMFLEAFPVLLRLIAAVLLMWFASVSEGGTVILLTAAALLVFGIAGRVVAIAVAVSIGAGLVGPAAAPSLTGEGLEVALFVVVLIIFLCGTGRFSLWQPEKRLFRKRGAPT